MNKFSKQSLKKLNGVHPELIALMINSIKESPTDFSIICGVRTLEQQKKEFEEGDSKADGIKNKSKHQINNDGWSIAVDICPYIEGKLDWKNTEAFISISKHIKETAKKMQIKIAWGGDWKGSWDKPHYELK